MGTIPAPNIVADAEQISQNPLAEDARAVQLGQEQQQFQQEQQQREIQTQVAQQQLKDQQAMTAAMHQWDGKDFDQLPELMRQNGISGPGYINAMNSVLARKQQIATLDKTQLENMASHHDAALSVIDGWKSLPDEQLSQGVMSGAQRLQAQGHLTAAEADQVIQHSQSMPPDQFRPWLDVYEKGLTGEKQLLDNAKTQAQTSQASGEAAAAQALVPQRQAEAKKARYTEANGILYDVSGDKPVPAVGANMTPQQYDALVDNMTGANQALNMRTKSQVHFYLQQGNVKAAQDAITKAGEEVGAIDKETNPAVINAEVNKAVRTEVGKAAALAPDVSTLIRKTASGRQYLSAEDLQGDSGKFVRIQAANAGIPVVDKDTAGTLEDIDTTRANLNYMMKSIQGKLASGAPGRLWYGPKNTIEKIIQSDPTFGAMGTWRTGAIQSLRSVAGSKGLRINQAEIETAQDNDIPKMTDTLPVAEKKLQNLGAFLDHAEQAHLVHDRTSMPGAPPPTGATHIGVGSQDHQKHYLDANGKDLGLVPSGQ